MQHPEATSPVVKRRAPRPGSRATLVQPLEVLQHPDALLKKATVIIATGLSASSIDRKVAAGQFPAPVRMGTRCTRFVSSSVTAWLQAQSARR